MIRVTIAVPEDFIEEANELASCIGWDEADKYTFTRVTHRDGEGNLYAVASGLVEEEFLSDALSPLEEPSWGADLDKAEMAQAMVQLGNEEFPAAAGVDKIAALALLEADQATSLMGLTNI